VSYLYDDYFKKRDWGTYMLLLGGITGFLAFIFPVFSLNVASKSGTLGYLILGTLNVHWFGVQAWGSMPSILWGTGMYIEPFFLVSFILGIVLLIGSFLCVASFTLTRLKHEKINLNITPILSIIGGILIIIAPVLLFFVLGPLNMNLFMDLIFPDTTVVFFPFNQNDLVFFGIKDLSTVNYSWSLSLLSVMPIIGGSITVSSGMLKYKELNN